MWKVPVRFHLPSRSMPSEGTSGNPFDTCCPGSSHPHGHTLQGKPFWHRQHPFLPIPADSRTLLPANWLQKAVVAIHKDLLKSSPRTLAVKVVCLFVCFRQGLSLNFPFDGFTVDTEGFCFLREKACFR